MATLVIGDIHGNLDALDDLLEQVGRAVGSDDSVVFLGDDIYRGPDAKGCVEGILRFRAETRSKSRKVESRESKSQSRRVQGSSSRRGRGDRDVFNW